MLEELIRESRYGEDAERLEGLRADTGLQAALAHLSVPEMRHERRAYYLARGVRVLPQVLPELHATLEGLRRRVGLEGEFDAYVVPDQSLNAGIARGYPHALLILHAGLLNQFSEAEMLFVIGHELGHAMYDHIDVHEQGGMSREDLGAERLARLHAWSRAAEISADRVGLLCCGDLDAALSAIFKLASGLKVTGSNASAASFAAQWDQYVDEVVDVGEGPFNGMLTHPLPHLRMKALAAFADAGLTADPDDGGAWAENKRKVDDQVSGMLRLLDPLAREQENDADPFLVDFLLWGGLYLALSDGELDASERDHIAGLVSAERLDRALARGMPSVESCLAQFDRVLAERRKKLAAWEIYRIIDGLAQLAIADRRIVEQELGALDTLAARLGVSARLVMAQYLGEGQ